MGTFHAAELQSGGWNPGGELARLGDGIGNRWLRLANGIVLNRLHCESARDSTRRFDAPTQRPLTPSNGLVCAAQATLISTVNV